MARKSTTITITFNIRRFLRNIKVIAIDATIEYDPKNSLKPYYINFSFFTARLKKHYQY